MYMFLGRAPSKPWFLFSTKMKLVPFILTTKKVNGFTITSLNVFLAHAGKAVWKTEESGDVPLQTLLSDYCEPNGFVVEATHVDKWIAYFKIDGTQTNLHDFYSWEEALASPAKPECWRRFYFIQDADGANWWSPQGLLEAEIADLGTIQDVFHSIVLFFQTPKNE